MRLPGCKDPDTVVFAHYASLGLAHGMGFKGVDWIGCPACFTCHDAVDGRAGDFERDFVRLAHAEATLKWLEEMRCREFVILK